VAIGAGYCFAMAGFLLVAQALGEDRPRGWPLAGAGLCFGLAAGCRPNFALLAVLMVALVGFRLRSYKTRALAFVGPVVVCGVLLAGYNYVRFQNPFDFGMQYALLANRTDLNDHFSHSLRNILPSLYALIVSPARLVQHDPSMGLLWGAPIALLGLCTPGVLRYRRVRDSVKLNSTRFIVYGVYVSTLGILGPLALLGFVLGRYSVDFAPEFVLLSWCLLSAVWQTVQGLPKTWQMPFEIAVVAAALHSAVFDLSICLSRVPPR
jgi:hypothetical protein